MFLPMDGDIVKNHDRFTSSESGVTGATPEALAGLFPMTYQVSPEVERATIGFYLGRVEPYIGHPMLSAPLGVYAARLGDRRRSLQLFEVGYAEFVNPPFGEVNEFSRTRFPDNPVVGPASRRWRPGRLAAPPGSPAGGMEHDRNRAPLHSRPKRQAYRPPGR